MQLDKKSSCFFYINIYYFGQINIYYCSVFSLSGELVKEVILKDKFIFDKKTFNRKDEWTKWTIINKILNKKGVKNPDLWISNRWNHHTI